MNAYEIHMTSNCIQGEDGKFMCGIKDLLPLIQIFSCFLWTLGRKGYINKSVAGSLPFFFSNFFVIDLHASKFSCFPLCLKADTKSYVTEGDIWTSGWESWEEETEKDQLIGVFLGVGCWSGILKELLTLY